jgi:hypothetical protein
MESDMFSVPESGAAGRWLSGSDSTNKRYSHDDFVLIWHPFKGIKCADYANIGHGIHIKQIYKKKSLL